MFRRRALVAEDEEAGLRPVLHDRRRGFPAQDPREDIVLRTAPVAFAAESSFLPLFYSSVVSQNFLSAYPKPPDGASQ